MVQGDDSLNGPKVFVISFDTYVVLVLFQLRVMEGDDVESAGSASEGYALLEAGEC